MLYKCLEFAGQVVFPSDIVHFPNAGSMLDQRRRRWPNIKTALGECLVRVVSILKMTVGLLHKGKKKSVTKWSNPQCEIRKFIK